MAGAEVVVAGADVVVDNSVVVTATVVEIFGTISGGQDVVPGTYTDLVTATVDF